MRSARSRTASPRRGPGSRRSRRSATGSGETVRPVLRAEGLPTAFPWRTATLVAGGLALLELIGLLAIGALLLAPHAKARRSATSAHVVKHHAAPARHVAAIPAKDRFEAVPLVPMRPRAHVRVLVLNGNGVAGAAHAEAARLQSLGYRIGGAANAPRHAYSRSMVMYVPGYVREARRLSRETGIRLVAPVDGVTPASLRTARLVVLLGS